MVEEHISQAIEELKETLEEISEELDIQHKVWEIYDSVYYSVLKKQNRIALIGVKETPEGKKRETYGVYEYSPSIQHALDVFLRYMKAYKYLQKACELLDFSDYQGTF